MREVFAGRQRDPGAVFYTITEADVGRHVIQTEIGPVYLVNVLGRIMAQDVGKRLYRRTADDGASWHWEAEDDAQRDRRLARKGKNGE